MNASAIESAERTSLQYDSPAGTKTGNSAIDISPMPLEAMEAPIKPLQHGVKKIEAVTTSWSKVSLWAVFVSLWFIYFNKSLDGNTTAQLAPYATSAFKSHSLLPLLTVISSIASAVIYLPISKLIDIFGRAEGFALMTLLSTLGSILTAATPNVGTYFAAKIFKTIGTNGVDFVGTVLIADITTLINRAFYLGLTATPYVGTTWAGPAIANQLLRVSWRWGYAIFAITTPVVCVPLLYFLFDAQVKTKHNIHTVNSYEVGGLEEQESKKKHLEWFWEFDIIGLVLACAGFSLLLLAVTLAKYNGSTWRSTHIIVMLVLGPLIIITCAVWERSYSPKPFLPFYLFTDRTILSACLAGSAFRIAYYMWDNYFTSYLQVVFGLSVRNAGYVDNIYSIVTCAWAPFLGLIVRRYGRYKLIALLAIPIHLLGAGLMISFRHQSTHIGLICMCQVLIALGGGTLNNMEEIAVMANSSHQNIASVLAFKAFFSYMGSAMGSAMSGAIWSNEVPKHLEKYLPGMSEKQIKTIFSSLTKQLSYKMGSQERDGIIQAYVDVQKTMTICATCIVAGASVLIFIWRDVKLREVKQVPGRLL